MLLPLLLSLPACLSSSYGLDLLVKKRGVESVVLRKRGRSELFLKITLSISAVFFSLLFFFMCCSVSDSSLTQNMSQGYRSTSAAPPPPFSLFEYPRGKRSKRVLRTTSSFPSNTSTVTKKVFISKARAREAAAPPLLSIVPRSLSSLAPVVFIRLTVRFVKALSGPSCVRGAVVRVGRSPWRTPPMRGRRG